MVIPNMAKYLKRIGVVKIVKWITTNLCYIILVSFVATRMLPALSSSIVNVVIIIGAFIFCLRDLGYRSDCNHSLISLVCRIPRVSRLLGVSELMNE
jgi:hypothetical protein